MRPLKNASIYELDQFVKRSTIADKKEDVARFLLYFMTQSAATETVKQFIKTLLHNDNALNKVVIVSENALYETVVTLTSRHLCEPSLFHVYEEKAETLFLHIHLEENERALFNHWRERYSEKQFELVNLILDEYLLLKKWYHLSQQEKYQQSMEKWKQLLSLILTEGPKEKDR